MAPPNYSTLLPGEQYEDEEQENIAQRKDFLWHLKPKLNACSRKFSKTTLLSFLIAFVSMPAAAGFLCFIWVVPGTPTSDNIWLNFVLRGWILKAVTTSALVVRTAGSTLAG